MTYNRGKGKCIDFLRSLIGHQGDDCVDWPFSKGHDGYGRIGYLGKPWTANRLMCILAHGEPPTPEHQAAHSCNKGHLGCVNPKHLSWKTVAENEADKKEAGMACGGRGNRTSLTPEQVEHIRANRGIIPIKVLARQHGLKFSGVRYWQTSTHRPVPAGIYHPDIRSAMAKRAKSLRAEGKTYGEIGQEMNLHHQAARRLAMMKIG